MKLRLNPELTDGAEAADEAETAPGENRLREPLGILILFLLCLCVAAVLKPDSDPDLFARLAVGKLVVETGQVSTNDPFSYTPKAPKWIDHEWGAGVLFYLVASAAGQKGLLSLKALLMFGTLAFMYLRARRATGRAPSLFFHVLLVGALYVGFLTSIRAQTLTFFLFSAWLYLLERVRDGNWRLAWLLPVSGVVWANLHGGFLAGLGLIFLVAIGQRLQGRSSARLFALGCVVGLSSLVNPYGLDYWAYLWDATMMSRAHIGEWAPLSLFGSPALFLGFKLLLLLAIVALRGMASRSESPDYATILTLGVSAVLGLAVMRHTTFFVIASAPVVWAWMASLLKRGSGAGGPMQALRTWNSPLVEASYYGVSRGLLLVGTILALSSSPFRIVLFSEFPTAAVDFIAQNHLRGNLLIPFNFGGYAIWRLYPDCRVAMDGRYETVYKDSTYQAVRNFFAGGPGWSEFLDQYPHDLILVSPRRDVTEKNLAGRTDWQLSYQDEKSLVYVRKEAVRAWVPNQAVSRMDVFSTAQKPRYVP